MKKKSLSLILLLLMVTTARAEQYLVDIPHLCVKLDKVSGSNVSFVTTDEKCQGGPSKIPVDFPAKVTQIEVTVDGKLFKKQQIFQSNFDTSIADVKARAEAFSNINPNAIESPAMIKAREAASQAYAATQTDEYKGKIQAYKDTLEKDIQAKLPEGFYTDTQKYTKKNQKEEKKGGVSLDAGDRIYIFISSSLPPSVVRTYAADLHKIAEPNAALYMRGVIGDISKLKPTFSYIASILRKDPQCDFTSTKCDMFGTEAIIDANVFRRYGIDRVPAVVYVRNVMSHDPEWSEGDLTNTKTSSPFVVYGDSSLAAALLEIQKEAKSPALEGVIEKLIGSGRYF